jgi:hypothetical protein
MLQIFQPKLAPQLTCFPQGWQDDIACGEKSASDKMRSLDFPRATYPSHRQRSHLENRLPSVRPFTSLARLQFAVFLA